MIAAICSSWFAWACLSPVEMQKVVDSGCQNPITAGEYSLTIHEDERIFKAERKVYQFVGCADNDEVNIYVN